MNKLDQIFAESADPKGYVQAYNEYLSTLLSSLVSDSFNQYIELILATAKTNNHIYIIGNGGSAATASHYANDINYGVRNTESGLHAVSLTDNNAVLTALGNDYGYEHIFAKQLEKFLKPGDIVIAISASGNSPNIVNAMEMAKANGRELLKGNK